MSVNATHLQVWSRREFLVRKELRDFLPGRRLVRLVAAFRSESRGDALEIPWLNTVVFGFPPVNISFNGKSLVTEYEACSSVSTCSSNLFRPIHLTYMIGFNLFLIIVLNSCAVSCRLPSPTKSIVRRPPNSFAAKAAP